jgi:hypothetical protein
VCQVRSLLLLDGGWVDELAGAMWRGLERLAEPAQSPARCARRLEAIEAGLAARLAEQPGRFSSFAQSPRGRA